MSSNGGATSKVADRMTRDPITLQRNDTLTVADERMRDAGIRHLPVLDEDGLLCGMLSQRDLFRGAVLRSLGYGTRAEQLMLDSLLVKEAMTEDPRTVPPSATLAQAAALLVKHGVGALPVMEGERLVGILTEGDFVRLALEE